MQPRPAEGKEWNRKVLVGAREGSSSSGISVSGYSVLSRDKVERNAGSIGIYVRVPSNEHGAIIMMMMMIRAEGERANEQESGATEREKQRDDGGTEQSEESSEQSYCAQWSW